MGINWDPCSNAEFAPPERDAVVVETERRVEQLGLLIGAAWLAGVAGITVLTVVLEIVL